MKSRFLSDFFGKDGKLSVQMGNFFYFLFIIILFFVIFFSIKLCNKKGKKFSYKFILTILICNCSLHFIKQLFPTYMKEWPNSLWKSTFENLCAALIILSPFIFISKNKYLKDYMYYIGIISGLGVYLFPYGSMYRDLRDIDTLVDILRFYICHCPLVLCGYLMVQQGFHKLDYHRLHYVVFTYLFFQSIIFLNDVIMFIAGVPEFKNAYGSFQTREGWLNFLYRTGPANESVNLGFKEDFDKMLGFIYIPYLMTYKIDAKTYFVPVLWQFIPVFILQYPLGFVMSYPFQKEQMKIDYERHKINKKFKDIK